LSLPPLLLIHESVSLCEELFKFGMLARVIWNKPYAEGKIIASPRLCVERTQFLVDSVTNRLDVVFGSIGD
jgi:hypothetical protein